MSNGIDGRLVLFGFSALLFAIAGCSNPCDDLKKQCDACGDSFAQQTCQAIVDAADKDSCQTALDNNPCQTTNLTGTGSPASSSGATGGGATGAGGAGGAGGAK